MNLSHYDYDADDYLANDADLRRKDESDSAYVHGADSSVTNPAGLAGVGGSLPLPAGPAGKVPSLSDLATPELDAALLRASAAPGLSGDERTELQHLRYLLLLARVKGRE
jgi:hypothetical protein